MRKMILWQYISLLFVICGISYAAEWGEFRGSVKAEWNDDGVTMTLLEDFAYIDPKGIAWIAPEGSKVDGASIPRLAWTTIGGPFKGKYRNASVVHDVACVERKRPWESVHESFYYAMRAGGVSIIKAKIMYAAVYLGGPRWPFKIKHVDISPSQAEKLKDQVRISTDSDSTITEKITPNEESRAAGGNNVDLLIRVEPSMTKLTEEMFKTLQVQIETNDHSLEEIQNLKFN